MTTTIRRAPTLVDLYSPASEYPSYQPTVSSLMTIIDNVLDSEVLAQSEDAQDEGNTLSAAGAPIEKVTTNHLYPINTHLVCRAVPWVTRLHYCLLLCSISGKYSVQEYTLFQAS